METWLEYQAPHRCFFGMLHVNVNSLLELWSYHMICEIDES